MLGGGAEGAGAQRSDKPKVNPEPKPKCGSERNGVRVLNVPTDNINRYIEGAIMEVRINKC